MFINFLFLDNGSDLHVVHTESCSSAATFRDKHGESYGQPVKGIWPTSAPCRCLIQNGYPTILEMAKVRMFVCEKKIVTRM